MKFLIIALFLMGCGQDQCEGADAFTSQGVCVFFNGFDVNMDWINTSIQSTHDIALEVYSEEELRTAEQLSSIKFVASEENDEDGANNYGIGHLGAEDSFGITIEYKEYTMYSRTIPHEIIHSYLIYVDENTGHPADWFVQRLDRIATNIAGALWK